MQQTTKPKTQPVAPEPKPEEDSYYMSVDGCGRMRRVKIRKGSK